MSKNFTIPSLTLLASLAGSACLDEAPKKVVNSQEELDRRWEERIRWDKDIREKERAKKERARAEAEVQEASREFNKKYQSIGNAGAVNWTDLAYKDFLSIHGDDGFVVKNPGRVEVSWDHKKVPYFQIVSPFPFKLGEFVAVDRGVHPSFPPDLPWPERYIITVSSVCDEMAIGKGILQTSTPNQRLGASEVGHSVHMSFEERWNGVVGCEQD